MKTKYVVKKDFLDRYDNLRHCRPGEIHTPPNEQRAQQLLDQGFIALVKEPQETSKDPKNSKGAKEGDGEVPGGKGHKKNMNPPAGEGDGETPTSE